MDRRAKAAEYLARDWSCFETAASAHFRTLRASHGEAAMLSIGDELREHAKRQQPGWPTARDRARDRRDHLKLIEILDRVPSRRR